MRLVGMRWVVLVGSIVALTRPISGYAEDVHPPTGTSQPPTASQPAASPPSATPTAKTSANGQANPTAGPDQAPRLLAKRFDDWTWRCVAPADGKTPPTCEAAQTVRVNQNGKAIDILNLAVSRASDKSGKVEWALVTLTPLDVHLPSDFGLTVGGGDGKVNQAKSKTDRSAKDSEKPTLTRYRNCNQMGCFVVTPLDAAMITRLKQAHEGAGFFRLVNGKTVKVVFSLKGFDKAIEALAGKDLPPPVAVTDAPTNAQPASASSPQ